MSNLRPCTYCNRRPGETCCLEGGCIQPLKYDEQGRSADELMANERAARIMIIVGIVSVAIMVILGAVMRAIQ